MIYLKFKRIEKIEDAIDLLQMAIKLEFSTLPPYLYALYAIRPGTNAEASGRIRSVAMQEMVHMCLACNILNALGTNPALAVPTYPGPLPGGITGGGKEPLIIHLLPFSKDAMAQAMAIEEPEEGAIPFPHVMGLAAAEPTFMTIGQFYGYLDSYLKTLPPSQWTKGRNQIDDRQFLQGEVFAVNGYDDAHKAIVRIVSEGEGHKKDPLDFQGEVSHYYRFGEIFCDEVLTKADNPLGFAWTGTLGVDWTAVYPAIADPGSARFLQRSAAGAGRAGSMRRGVHASGSGAAKDGHRQRGSSGQRGARHVRSAPSGQARADRSAGGADPSGRPELPLSAKPQKGGCAMSVLETPRLVFRGQITWDPITTNNYTQQYDEADARNNFPTNAEDVAAFRKDAIDAVQMTGADTATGIRTAPIVRRTTTPRSSASTPARD